MTKIAAEILAEKGERVELYKRAIRGWRRTLARIEGEGIAYIEFAAAFFENFGCDDADCASCWVAGRICGGDGGFADRLRRRGAVPSPGSIKKLIRLLEWEKSRIEV
jgi:hypothetical protein